MDADAKRRVRYAHHDWRQIVMSDAFGDWLQGQPQSVQDMASSARYDEVIALIDAFQLDTSPRICGMPPASDVLH